MCRRRTRSRRRRPLAPDLSRDARRRLAMVHELLIAEIGQDMSRFGSSRQLGSWAGM
jgi:transposase